MSITTPKFLHGSPLCAISSRKCESIFVLTKQASNKLDSCSPRRRLCVEANSNTQGLRSEGGSLRLSLMSAIFSQAARQTEEGMLDIINQASKILGSGNEFRSFEEAFMTVPDLESIPTRVLARENDYEIREVQAYLVAQTDMGSRSDAWDFFSSSQAFNTLAGYLFGKNSRSEGMEMTTPVITRQQGEQMEMTTPVLNKQGSGGQWQMAFVIPSKYNENNVPLPQDSAVTFQRVPSQTVAVIVFSGLLNDALVREKEMALRSAILKDPRVSMKADSILQIAQFNPPFTPPFMRRNEISIDIEWKPWGSEETSFASQGDGM